MKLKLKFKKIFAALVTGFMAVSMLAGIPSSYTDTDGNSNGILQTFEKMSLNAEPFTASAASNFRRTVNNESPMWIVHIDSRTKVYGL